MQKGSAARLQDRGVKMIDILRKPDDIQIICEGENVDAIVTTEIIDRKMNVCIAAEDSHPCFIVLRWNDRANKPIRIMGDKWERSFADMEWSSLNGEKFMPWYFMASNGIETVGCGVMVQPNSFVCFQYDASGVTAWFDVRCGSKGVCLQGRTLLAGVVVCEHYQGITEFQAAKQFCHVMSPNPILPKEPIYGSNNWYYAYGKSSREEIISDAKLLAELTADIENRPYLVVDDGWQMNSCAGPWLPNEKFGCMKTLADELKNLGIRPGLWFRPLHDLEAYKQHPQWRFQNKGEFECLDPSNPGVKEYLRNVIRRFRQWGYEIIKHDYSTYDMFERFGFDLNGKVVTSENWSFYDRTKTSAQIVLDFYRLIREEAKDMIVIGCNTFSHFSAGLFELNRIGDDTSGKNWSRTRALGVNTIAFRMCQNDSFYKVDADCVGILEDRIPWKLNKQWLTLLAKSGSPLFVSAQPAALTEEMKRDLKEAFLINAVQDNSVEPLDWLYNNIPQKWLIDGEIYEFDFVMDSYPALLANRTQEF